MEIKRLVVDVFKTVVNGERMAMTRWWKPQKVQKAREGLVGMAHGFDDRTSVPQHVFMHLLKIPLSGKTKDRQCPD